MSDHRIPLKQLAAASRSHSIFSPSGSAMWAYCSGSLVPNVQVRDTAGIEAAEGTVAHGVGELWLKTGHRPSHLIGTVERVIEGEGDECVVFEIEIDEEMLDYVEMYVDWCRFLEGDHFTEVRVDFSQIMPIPNQGGTADHAACEPRRLTITDLKYGRGVQVYAENNTQALLYAYGFFLEYDWMYDFQTIVIRICQPRKNHFDEWEITREELLTWAAWLGERAALAWQYDAPRTPGEKQCQWCKIKPDCKAYAVWMERLTADCFENLDEPVTPEDMDDLVSRLDAGGEFAETVIPVEELTLAHKSAIYSKRAIIEKWLRAIGDDLYRRLQQGEDVPGWKLVPGRSSRAFTSEKDAVGALEFAGLEVDEILPRQLISPAQAEAVLVKKGFKRKQLPLLLDKVVRRSKGSYVMVENHDPRPSVAEVVDDSFRNLDDL